MSDHFNTYDSVSGNGHLNLLLSAAGFFPESVGGGEMYVYRLAKELQKRGHRVTVLLHAKWKEDEGRHNVREYFYDGIRVLSFSLDPSILSAEEYVTGLGPETSRLIEQILKEISPDVVHINAIAPALIQACNLLHIPHLITAHHAGIVCPGGGLVKPDGSICGEVARPEVCVPCCCLHRWPRWYTGGLVGRIPAFLYQTVGKRYDRAKEKSLIGRGMRNLLMVERELAAERMVLEQAGLIIAPSKAIRELLVRNGCSLEKILLIPHGVEPISCPPLRDIETRPLRFGYIGRFDPAKGLHKVFASLELLDESHSCEFHLFGEACHPLHKEYYRKLSEAYRGKSRIFEHGPVSPQQLPEAYAAIDILVVPSLLPEAFGLVVNEAFSAGRPVIVFNSGALPELVRDGEDGFIIRDNDEQTLAVIMRELIKNPLHILDLAKQIPKVKNTEEYVEEMLLLYASIINTRNKQSHALAARG